MGYSADDWHRYLKWPDPSCSVKHIRLRAGGMCHTILHLDHNASADGSLRNSRTVIQPMKVPRNPPPTASETQWPFVTTTDEMRRRKTSTPVARSRGTNIQNMTTIEPAIAAVPEGNES